MICMTEIDTTDQHLEDLKLTSYMEAIAKDSEKNVQHCEQVGSAHYIVDQYNLKGIIASTGEMQRNIEIVHTSSSREIQLQTKTCAVVDYWYSVIITKNEKIM